MMLVLRQWVIGKELAAINKRHWIFGGKALGRASARFGALWRIDAFQPEFAPVDIYRARAKQALLGHLAPTVNVLKDHGRVLELNHMSVLLIDDPAYALMHAVDPSTAPYHLGIEPHTTIPVILVERRQDVVV